MQKSNTGGSNVYPNFALDDVGCNGTESNLLDCLPWHNCGLYNRGAENAGAYAKVSIVIIIISVNGFNIFSLHVPF